MPERLEFIEQAQPLPPRASIIFTPQLTDAARTRSGARILAHPLDSAKLSRFIRLVAGRPAVPSTLHSLCRKAHRHAEAAANACEPLTRVGL